MNDRVMEIINSQLTNQEKALELLFIGINQNNVREKIRILNLANNLNKDNVVIKIELMIARGCKNIELYKLADMLYKKIDNSADDYNNYLRALRSIFYFNYNKENYIEALITGLKVLELDKNDEMKIRLPMMNVFFILDDIENITKYYKLNNTFINNDIIEVSEREVKYNLVKLIYYIKMRNSEKTISTLLRLCELNPLIVCYIINCGDARKYVCNYSVDETDTFTDEAKLYFSEILLVMSTDEAIDFINEIDLSSIIKTIFQIDKKEYLILLLSNKYKASDISKELFNTYKIKSDENEINKIIDKLIAKKYLYYSNENYQLGELTEILINLMAKEELS